MHTLETLYSYLKASIGLSLDALFAGNTPKITPINAENRNPIRTTTGLMTASKGSS